MQTYFPTYWLIMLEPLLYETFFIKYWFRPLCKFSLLLYKFVFYLQILHLIFP